MTFGQPAENDGCLRLRLSADAAGLAAGQQALSKFLAASGASFKGAYYAELAYEELVTNIIRHGRPAGPTPIRILACATPSTITLEFEDDGAPFDPMAVPEPVRPATLDDAVVGGLGIFLIRKVARHVGYVRVGDTNRVSVTIAAQDG